MSRILRLFAYAVVMLVIAVLACLVLRDGDDGAGKTRLEVTGKLEGLTNHQGDTTLPAAPSPIKDVKVGKGDAVPAAPAQPEKADAKAHAPESKKAEPSRELASAKVKVLVLAKAAAEKRQLPAQTSEKLDMPKVVEDAAPVESAVPAAPVVEPAPAVAPAPVVVEAPAAPKAASAAPAPAQKVEKPAEKSAKKSAAKTAEKAPARSSAKSSPAVLKKFEGSRIEVDPVEAKVAALKAEARKSAPKKTAAPKLSAVESALADARAGRLAPEKIASEKTTAAEKPASYDRVVTSARFVMQGSLIKLVLKGNAPMVGHYYVLESPDRVVLDLAGNWQVELPKVPSNRLIRAVRVGQHDDKTRLVFDMKTTGKVALVPLNRNALELHIR